MRKRVLQLSREIKFDVIHVQQAYLAPIVPRSSSLVVLDMLDILSEYERQFVQTQSKMTHRFQKWMEWKKMQVLERQAVHLSNASITMSENDKARIARLYPDAQVWVIPNGVDLDYFRSPTLLNDRASRTSNQIVFVGSMNYLPNADAVRWFYNEIFKLIQQQIHPDDDSVGTYTNQDIHFTIVGLEPPNDIIEIGKDPCVTVTGWVEDVRPYIQNAAVIIVPLRYGSGTRLKILEAWAMGKAIVSTTLGAEGLPVKHGENILLADQPNDFATAVSTILHDTATKLKLELSGRKLVENRFSWKSVADSMEQVYQCAS
jgi:glycosyltransferase involved in cell wall biosynthesis